MTDIRHERLQVLDIAKGLAVLFMILVHVNEMFYLHGEDSGSMATGIIEFLGSPPAAPVFMVALGVGIVYSRHNSPARLAKRGLTLLVVSYIYNVVVYAMPYILAYLLRGHDPENLEYGLQQILSVDILQFAAVTFLFMALVKKLRLKDWQLACITVVCPVLSRLLENNIHIQQTIPAELLGYLWRTHEMSNFPFLSWIFFPVAGYIMAKHFLSKYENRSGYYKVSGIIGLLVYIIMSVIAYYAGISYGAFGELYQEAYYGMGLYGNICIFSFVVFWLAFCFFAGKLLPEICRSFLAFLSKHSLIIYICQYFLIYYIQVVVVGEENSFTLGIVFVLTVLFLLVSCIAAQMLAKQQRAWKENR